MSVLFLLIPLCVAAAGVFLAAFIWAARSGQFDEPETNSLRPLLDEPPTASRKGDPISKGENQTT